MSRLARRNTILDLAALTLLLLYGLLAWSAEGGGGGSGPALDPVWAAARERGVLRVAVDVGFRPFADQDAAGTLSGYDIDLARAVAERLGLRAEFVPIGYDALYDALVSGRADMIASALPYAPEQGFRARFSSVYFDVGQMLVVPEGAPIDGPADLAGRTVGVALGSDADALARRMARDGGGFTLRSTYDDPAAALADLGAGRLDAVITDHVAALTAAQGTPGLRIATALSYEPLVLGLPRAAFQLESEVNRALDELQAAGFLAELSGRWFR
jgi:polar amino acid transport system substrate-binding protein